MNIDYHIAFDTNYYCVPYNLAHELVEVHSTPTTIEPFYKGQRVASHSRARGHGQTVTVTAIEENPARAIVKAQAAYSDPLQRAIHLEGVSQTLVQFRSYAQASTLMAAAARLMNASDVQARAEMLAKMRHWEDAMMPESDLRWPVQKLVLQAFQGTLTAATIKPIMSRRLIAESDPEEIRTMQMAVSMARQQLSTA